MLNVNIYTPNGIIYQGNDVNGVMLPTSEGIIGIYEDHEPLIGILAPGQIILEKLDHNVYFAVSGGVLNIDRGSNIYILADTAENGELLDEKRALEAKKRAEEFLNSLESEEDEQFAKLQAKIEKEIARLTTIGLIKKNNSNFSNLKVTSSEIE